MRFTFLMAGLVLAWGASSQTPSNIEAVEYDPQGNRWFVSNGSSLLVTEDGGSNWSFFGEAQASHGMEVMNGVLYAIGDNVIRSYDLADATLLGTLAIPGVVFLNGMGNNGAGTLVVSDFSGGRLHAVDASDPTQMTHTPLTGSLGVTPNGVVVDVANNRAIVVCWGNNADIIAVDLESGEVTPLVDGTGLGNLDGIDDDGQGQYYVSSWSPTRVTRYNADFTEAVPVLGAQDGLSNPADISYAEALDILGIANSGSDAVSFHAFGETSDLTEMEAAFGASRRQDTWTVSLAWPAEVTWAVYDAVGRVLSTRTEPLPSGTVHMPWPSVPPGGFLEVRSVEGWRAVLR